jgi:glycosyltransferase involved in cell wall biosynthesis
MRILLVQGGFGAGGAEKVVALLAAHWAARGDDVHVAGLTETPGGPFFDHPPQVTLHVARPGAEAVGRGAQLRRFRHIRRCLTELRPDVAVAFLTKVNTLTVLAATGLDVPVVISERNNPSAQGKSALWGPLNAVAAQRAAAIVMQTERARAQLPADPRRRARVIPNPCAPIGRPRPGPPPGEAAHLLAVGRLDRQKGFDLLLDAFAAIRPRHPGVRLTIYGEGPERAALEAQIAALGIGDAVRLPGLTDRPGAWIGAGEVLVLPSRYEGFPNVVAEATVSGMPVVAFDCPYGPRELVVDGVNGLLVPDGDVGALAAALSRIVADAALRARMTAAADLNRERLSERAVMRQWDQTIEEIAAPLRLAAAS